MDHSQLAIDPAENIAVLASAGAGKTRLLIQRILKLLLNEVDPALILAITFTRKAAAEIRERLMTVLADWAAYNNQQLQKALQELAHPYDPDSITKARNLYEQLLYSEYEIRITTFHAFCHDILKRFALHAGVPAGFHLVETTEELQQEARSRLYKLARQSTKQPLADALFELSDHVNTVHNINAILDAFIDARSDWWSFTENQADPVNHATQCLHEHLFANQHGTKSTPVNLTSGLLQYQSYLVAHNTLSNQRNSDLITASLASKTPDDELAQKIAAVFLTQNDTPRQLKPSKTLAKSLGQLKILQFIQLHENLCNAVICELDKLKKKKLLAFNRAWFCAGQSLLHEYQQLKFSRHILDFDDLEWYTYMLLNKQASAAWIQYKLDQRIEHILIDEFQDTNPTQWNLLFPLLEELAANLQPGDKNKSLFFVGDTKQSIYGFRRANPQLQFTASEWAKDNLAARILETDVSYRSSPAIINFVNTIFSSNEKKPVIDGFRKHEAAQTGLWGAVHIEPLITPENKIEASKEFRNPLLEPRINTELNCHYREGRNVAAKINALITSATPILDAGQVRPLCYRDIIILARNRIHLSQLELALREQHIPYTSVNDSEFLDQLEVQDILALLTFLIQPHNDLALAQTLRSPCFAISDKELMEIACDSAARWHEKLANRAAVLPESRAFHACMQLHKWQTLVNRVPVHDLLDHIYFDRNILARYASSCTATKKTQVLANPHPFIATST